MSKPITICFVCPKAYGLFDPAVKSGFGGAEVDLYMLATELAKDKAFSVRFITADYGQPRRQTIQNVQLFKSLKFSENSLTGARKIWRTMKQANARFYMIKTLSPGVPLVWTFCRLHKRKFMYRTAHQNECDQSYRSSHPLIGRLFEFCLRRADKVFVQNQSDGELLKQNLGLETVFIPNGHLFSQTESQEKKSILWVGRTADFKHPERFPELARAFPQEQFVMICRRATDDSAYDRIRQQADTVENLEFISEVEFARIGDYFAQAKVFVNTSDSEGFANTFIQAAAARTPILTWIVNPDNFLTQYQCGLACQGDADKLKQGLSFLLDQDRYIELGQNAAQYVRQHHDITAIAEQYKTIFRKMAGE